MSIRIRTKCMICGEIVYYSEKEMKEEFPSHCGKIRVIIDFSDFEIYHNRWIALDANLIKVTKNI